ncbi:glucosaminidase domain-containing protein [Novispirillum itersonii]|uniref:glucosaminidase domain-containing protein n=1 Tax=Novispirillum itersonii TaxID=189 RepID=UPI000361AC2D|nr:glucosaminidase domain-containing protein [Novispirillum itersonii]
MHQEPPFRRHVRVFDVASLGIVCACVSGLYAAAFTEMLAPRQSAAASGVVPAMAEAAVPSAPIARMLGLVRDPARQQIERVALPATGPQALTPSQRLDARATDRLYDRLSYGLDLVRDTGAPVPRVYLNNLPRDLKQVGDADQRKDLFLRILLPVVLKVNEEILLDRERLTDIIRLSKAGHRLPETDQRWLEVKAREYGLKRADLRQLERRMDVVPPSLVLAQAAEESGWGTSQVARHHNSLFGHSAWDGDRSSIKAVNRADGTMVRLRSFPTIGDAVRAYVINLNTHQAYNDFRAARAQLRKKGQEPDGLSLSGTLLAYSERGQAYVETLNTLIRGNGLSALDRAQLSDKPIEVAALSPAQALPIP